MKNKMSENGIEYGEPDRKLAVVDTAWGGGDSLCMPIAYVYGEDVYIADVVFNNGDKTVARPIVIGKLKKHHPHMVRWESNNGGIVDEALRSEGVRINMSYKKALTNQSKFSRIIQFALDIKTSISSMEEIEVLSMRNLCDRSRCSLCAVKTCTMTVLMDWLCSQISSGMG